MAAADNRYSRFVQLAKIVFPLLALGFLSTIFLFSRNLNPGDAIPFAELDVAEIAREQRLSAPRFSGLTSDGTAIALQAATARPDPADPRRLSADDVTATIRTEPGVEYEIVSDQAAFDGTKNRLDLTGDVRIDSADGYKMRTERLEADLDATGIRASGGISGTAPGATLSADQMELVPQGDTHLLVFKGGVKLVYTPEK